MGGDEGVDDLDGVEFRETEIVSRENGFKPLYLVSEWEEPGTIVMRIPVAFLLPSAVGTGMFSMRVRDGGGYLELTIIWPKVLVDIELMHRKCLKAGVTDSLAIYHPKFMGFRRALRKLRGLVMM